MADDRNYADEAKRIIQGELSMFPTVEHLKALAAQQESVTHNVKLTLHLITALMVDANEVQLHFPKGLLDAAERGFTKLDIVRNTDGSVTVTRRPIVTTPQPQSVN